MAGDATGMPIGVTTPVTPPKSSAFVKNMKLNPPPPAEPGGAPVTATWVRLRAIHFSFARAIARIFARMPCTSSGS